MQLHNRRPALQMRRTCINPASAFDNFACELLDSDDIPAPML